MADGSLPLLVNLARAWCRDHLQTQGLGTTRVPWVKRAGLAAVRRNNHLKKMPKSKKLRNEQTNKQKKSTDLWSLTEATTQPRVIQ